MKIEKRDSVLLIDGHPQRPDDAIRRLAAFAHLEREEYRSMSAALR